MKRRKRMKGAAGFELAINVENARPWDGLTWDQKHPQYPDGCPECGLKHSDHAPCYGGFHPDDDYGPAPGGDS